MDKLNEQINKIRQKMGLNEDIQTDSNISEFSYHSLSPDEKTQMYDTFSTAYIKSTGASWDADKFASRAVGWSFFGNIKGFVAVRKQPSGFYKLTGCAGELKPLTDGLGLLNSNGAPVWGMMDKRLANVMKAKSGFSTPSVIVLKIMFQLIPKSVFGGVDFKVNRDGSCTFAYADLGDVTKYFVANDLYYSKLKSGMTPDLMVTIKEKLKELTGIPDMVVNQTLKWFGF